MSLSNVVHLPERKYDEIKNADEAMSVLRRAMYEYHYKELADHIGVSASCIMSIRSGRTKWPRSHTFFALVKALGLEMHLVPARRKD